MFVSRIVPPLIVAIDPLLSNRKASSGIKGGHVEKVDTFLASICCRVRRREAGMGGAAAAAAAATASNYCPSCRGTASVAI